MIAQLIIQGNGKVIIDKVIHCECPNAFGGIGDITVHAAEKLFWTGGMHLSGETFCFAFGDVLKIQTRSDLAETDEDWVTVWESKKPFTYDQYHEGAKILMGLKLESPFPNKGVNNEYTHRC